MSLKLNYLQQNICIYTVFTMNYNNKKTGVLQLREEMIELLFLSLMFSKKQSKCFDFVILF